jgi:methylmalonyl-CoA carboxyltransferase large subunit
MMAVMETSDVILILEDIRRQLATLSERVERLEGVRPAPVPPSASLPSPAEAAAPEPEPEITEEELVAISAALAAYFGVRVRIRQIRLISSSAWAQEGRVSIQASHRLQ